MKVTLGYQVQFGFLRTHQPICLDCARFFKELYHVFKKRDSQANQTTEVLSVVDPEIEVKTFILQDYDPTSCWECGKVIDCREKA